MTTAAAFRRAVAVLVTMVVLAAVAAIAEHTDKETHQ